MIDCSSVEFKHVQLVHNKSNRTLERHLHLHELAHHNHTVTRTLRSRVQTTILQDLRDEHKQDHMVVSTIRVCVSND